MKLFICELYLRDILGLKDIKETSIKQVNKKQCYIITINSGSTKIKLLQSYDRIVAIYNCNTKTMLVECSTIKNNKARDSFSRTTTKHINIFIDMYDWVYLDNIVNFDYYYNLEHQRLIDRIK